MQVIRNGDGEFLLDIERRDPGQLLAFQPFQEGAAGGRDVGELVLDPGDEPRLWSK